MDTLVGQFVRPENDPTTQENALSSLFQSLQSNQLDLDGLVLLLRDPLTNLDEMVRSRGTLLLSQLLTRHTSWTLNDQQLTYLANFFVERLKDYSCHNEVLVGLRAVVLHHTLPQGLIQRVLRQIFNQVHVQTLPQASRKLVFDIFSSAMTRNLPALQEMKSDFVFGFIQSMDGEKDPRNLVIAFRIVTGIVNAIPEWKSFDEDLFDIIACYFPITFTERANDPEAIKKADLVDGLNNALSCSPLFAKYCIPLIIDKLQSTVVATKVSAVELLSICAERYGGRALEIHVSGIWGALRNEIMNGSFVSVMEPAFDAFSKVVSVLDALPDSSTEKSGLDRLLGLCINQCQHQIQNYDSKLSLLASRLLQTAASSSLYGCKKVMSQLSPIISQFFASDASLAKKHTLIKILIGYIKACGNFKFCSAPGAIQELMSVDPQPHLHPLHPFQQQIFEVFTSVLVITENIEGRADATSGIVLMALLEHGILFSESQIRIIISSVTSHITEFFSLESGAIDIELVQGSKDALVMLLDDQIALISEITIPQLMKVIVPNEKALHPDTRERVVFMNSLDTLSLFAAANDKLFNSVISQFSDLIAPNVNNSVYLKILLEATVRCLSPRSLSPVKNNNITVSLLFSLVSLMITGDNSVKPESFNVLTEEVPKLAASLTTFLDVMLQGQLVNSFTDLYLNGNTKGVLSKDIKFDVFSNDASAQTKRTIVVFTSVIGNAGPLVEIPSLEKLLTSLTSLSISETTNPKDQTEIFKTIGAIINKSNNEELLNEFLTQTFDVLLQKLPNPKAAGLAVWVVKALIVRGYKSAMKYWNEMQKLLASAALPISESLSQQYSNLFVDYPEFQNRRVLYKQKYFLTGLSTLLETFQSSADRKPILVTAISNLLKGLPPSVFLPELHRLIPVLFEAIRLPLQPNNQSLHIATLQTFGVLISSSPALMADHLSSFVPTLLTLASDQKSCLALRVEACTIIGSLTSLQYTKVQAYKKQVLRELAPVLDDKKRSVRKAAVLARNKWFSLQFSQ